MRTIPNFVDTDRIHPADRMTAYRAELGIGDEPVLLYAGNVGFSQSVELLVEAARRLPGISVVINGEGVALADVRRSAAGLANVRFAPTCRRSVSASCSPPAMCTPSRSGRDWPR